MTDIDDPSARQADGSSEPDALLPEAGAHMPSPTNGKLGPNPWSVHISSEINGSTHIQLSSAQSDETTWFDKLQCQLYGVPLPSGAHCIQGSGPIADDDQQQYKYWEGQVATLQHEIQQRTNTLMGESVAQQHATQAQARTQLVGAKAALSSAQQQLALQTQNVTSSITQDTGILAQLKALSDVTAGNSTLGWARILLFALFLIIDLMPVTIKLMLNLGPEGLYDQTLNAEEDTQLRTAAARRAARLFAGQAEAAAWERVQQEKLRRWEADQLQTEGGTATQADPPEDMASPSD